MRLPLIVFMNEIVIVSQQIATWYMMLCWNKT